MTRPWNPLAMVAAWWRLVRVRRLERRLARIEDAIVFLCGFYGHLEHDDPADLEHRIRACKGQVSHYDSDKMRKLAGERAVCEQRLARLGAPVLRASLPCAWLLP